ncbi:S41 family peptidase [Bacteroides sp. CG01]|uniref:S41 family peptidase n=1 Tax=Bacteroides sp. CG01 TaxID=3096000 RepID=UPI002AFF2043|nr:S41 family peptidase [Bacteroides sp. CG01]
MIKFSAYCQVCLLLGLLCAFSSCEKDDDKSDKAINQWIDATMRSWYLWYSDIPDKKQLNFNAEPETFFASLLSQSDGKSQHYSAIKKKKTTTRASLGDEPTLGFEFQSWKITDLRKSGVNILYVLPGSPAEEKGLKRGDWIFTINGSAVGESNLSALRSGESVRLGVADDIQGVVRRTVDLSPRMVEDNPVLLDTVYMVQNTKIGYLVYNHFTSGPDGDEDEKYNNTLRKSFENFKIAGVQEFILDLRYNGGGLVTSSQLLSTMLAPASALGDEFCSLVYNDKHQSNSRTLTLDKSYMKQGANGENLDLPRLIVLTSARTASASEAVINGLKPYYEVIVLGGQTEGKNVGSVTLENSKYDYELHPIVCRLYSKDKTIDYSNGFSPVWPQTEGQQLDLLVIRTPIQLGDINKEPLLNVALQWILTGGIEQNTDTRSSASFNAIPGYSSLDRKAMNGVQVPFTPEDVEW